MAYVVVEHRVEDWAEFERLFKRDSERRRTLGARKATALRLADDPRASLIVFEWADLASAQKFAAEWEATLPGSRVRVAEGMLELEA
jgi:hypothetical protein